MRSGVFPAGENKRAREFQGMVSGFSSSRVRATVWRKSIEKKLPAIRFDNLEGERRPWRGSSPIFDAKAQTNQIHVSVGPLSGCFLSSRGDGLFREIDRVSATVRAMEPFNRYWAPRTRFDSIVEQLVIRIFTLKNSMINYQGTTSFPFSRS